MSAPGSAPELLMVTRADCGLCEEMLAELEALRAQQPLPHIRLVDVDGDELLRRRYGLKVPVLLLGDTLVCEHRLDAAELLRLLRGLNQRGDEPLRL